MVKGNITSLTEKQLEQIVAKRIKYATRRTKQKRRDLDNNPTVDNLHRVVQTLIEDLQDMRILDK